MKEIKKWRSWEDFVEHARIIYGGKVLSFAEIEAFIKQKLHIKRLSPVAILCYINWCDNGYLTEAEVGRKLDISRTTVEGHIIRLRKVWPFLPGHPHAKGQLRAKKLPKDFRRMARIKPRVESGAIIRSKW